MTTSPTRVLCVDDNRDQADSLAELFVAVGFDARACYDGPQGLAAAAAFRPDACVLDVQMPGLDGYQLAAALRANLGGDLLLIAHSGGSGPDFPRRAAAAGFDRWFVKPADSGELVAALVGGRRPG